MIYIDIRPLMDILPFEIVLVIASADPLTFALMIQASSKVNNYIKTPTGRRCFLASCRKKQDSAMCKKTYLMFTDRLHSFFDKPAYTTISNITLQYKNDLPLIICNVEEQLWYQNGLKHRDNNPAVIRVNGIQVWYQYGKTHRTDGPALIYADGSTEWWIEGMRHRIDGPAVTHVSKNYEWMQANNNVDLITKHPTGNPSGKLTGHPSGKPTGKPTGYSTGKLLDQSSGKPPDQLQNINCEWWINNVKHRIGFPAVIYADGGNEWWQNGKLHREDGPASTESNGDHEWWINGIRHRIDGPAIINMHGRQVWYKNGKKHRDDGPAIIESNGDQFWFKNGKRYREGEITATRCIGVNENQWASSGRQ